MRAPANAPSPTAIHSCMSRSTSPSSFVPKDGARISPGVFTTGGLLRVRARWLRWGCMGLCSGFRFLCVRLLKRRDSIGSGFFSVV